MKNVTFFILLFAATTITFGEDSTQSKIELAATTKSNLFKQEVFTLDNVTGFRIDALRITNLETFMVTTGLKVVFKHQEGKETWSMYNYIDADEIDGIITSLQYMGTILKSKTIPANYTEIKYITKSGFQVMLLTILNESNKLDWGFNVQPDIKLDRSLVSMQNGDVEKLQKLFVQAKGKL
jgi:hypothetical protein